MSSISDARRELEELKNELAEVHTSLRQEITLLTSLMSLARRFSGDENVNAVIRRAQQAIMTLNLLRITIMQAQAAMGPIGWAMLGISGVTTAFSVADLATELDL